MYNGNFIYNHMFGNIRNSDLRTPGKCSPYAYIVGRQIFQPGKFDGLPQSALEHVFYHVVLSIVYTDKFALTVNPINPCWYSRMLEISNNSLQHLRAIVSIPILN